jgi:hypothetical protein
MMGVRISQRETGRTGVMRACTDLLDAERILYFRMNAGDRFGTHTSKRTGKTSKWRIRGHAAGTADLLLFISDETNIPRTVWVECKAPGYQPSAEQVAFRNKVLAIGHWYALIDDAALLRDWLKEHGVIAQ